MNFQFIITAHGYEKASKIEKFLKDNGIPFAEKVLVGVSNKTPRTRVIVTKEMMMAVTQNLASHPSLSDVEIAKMSGVSSATVGRVKRGEHALQRKEKKPALKPVIKAVKK